MRACNPSFSGRRGRRQEDGELQAKLDNKLVRHHLHQQQGGHGGTSLSAQLDGTLSEGDRSLSKADSRQNETLPEKITKKMQKELGMWLKW
jgi:hypothetical protein